VDIVIDDEVSVAGTPIASQPADNWSACPIVSGLF